MVVIFFAGRQVVHGWQTVYGNLNEIAVYAKAGAIIPMLPPINSDQNSGNHDNWNNLDDWSHIELHIFPNGEGECFLYEDDGESQHYKTKNAFATTRITQAWYEVKLLSTSFWWFL